MKVNEITPAVSPVPLETLPTLPAVAPLPVNREMLLEVPLRLTVELGRLQMSTRQVLKLQRGSIVELERRAGEAVDVLLNDRLIARGELVVVNDKFGIRLTELVTLVQADIFGAD